MRRLEQAIASAGYETLNLAYPSRKMPLVGLVEQIHARRDWIWHEGGCRTHFVTYSMGGLLVRAYITAHRPPNLGRVVMLAPPNGGSEIANLLARKAFYRRIFGPAGAELTTSPSAELLRLLGEIDYPLGIVAGDRFVDPLGWLLIPGPNDGRVSVEKTKARGMADHVTIRTTHSTMRWNREAIAQTIHFLRNGHFAHRDRLPFSGGSGASR